LNYRFALQALAVEIAKLNHYTPTGATRSPYTLMVVPMGFAEFQRTRPEVMYHFISGLSGSSKLPVSVPLNVAAYVDDVTGMRVMTHVPVSSYQSGGTGNPQVEFNEMQTAESFATYYLQSEPDEVGQPCIVTDFEKRNWATLPRIGGNAADGLYRWYARPQMTCVMDRLIIVTNPGSETGEIVVQWPSTGISTSQTGETLIGKFRVYMKAYLKRPENVLIVDGIRFAGIVAGAGTEICVPGTRYDENFHDLLSFTTNFHPCDYKNLWSDDLFRAQCNAYGIYEAYVGAAAFDGRGDRRSLPAGAERSDDLPVIFYCGTTREVGSDRLRTINNGHLGVLDHPRKVLQIEGANVFNELETPGYSSGL
jgi:hypothetical protein